MKLKTLYSACFGGHAHPFDALLADPKDRNAVVTAHEPEDLKEVNSALIVWGGADINPDYYAHPRHRTTYPGGERDRIEWGLVTAAVEKGIPIIGVCRGAQMLCAKAGGWLIQDVKGHLGSHWVRTTDDQFFLTNSIHHQMMAGLGTVDHELVAWSDKKLSSTYGYKDDQLYLPGASFKEPEFVYFPKIKGYAIQWHPEGMPASCSATQYILRYMTKKEKEAQDGFASIVLGSN